MLPLDPFVPDLPQPPAPAPAPPPRPADVQAVQQAMPGPQTPFLGGPLGALPGYTASSPAAPPPGAGAGALLPSAPAPADQPARAGLVPQPPPQPQPSASDLIAAYNAFHPDAPSPLTPPATIAFNNPDTAPRFDLQTGAPTPDSPFIGGPLSAMPGYGEANVSPAAVGAQQQWLRGMLSTPEGQNVLTNPNPQAVAMAVLSRAFPQVDMQTNFSTAYDVGQQVARGMPLEDALMNAIKGTADYLRYGGNLGPLKLAADTLHTITQAANAPFNLAQQGIESIPIGGQTLGERINQLPGPLPTVGHLATGAIAPVAADAASFGLLTPAFVGLGGLNAADVAGQYASGQLSWQDALKGIALNVAPFLIPGALHAAGAGGAALLERALSPEGQAFLARLGEETGGGRLPGGTPDNMFFRDEQGNRIPVGPEQPTGAVNFPRPGAIGDVGPGGQPVVQGVAEPLPGSPPARGTGGDPVGDFLQREQARQDLQARQAFWRPGQESAPPGVGGPDVAGNALARLDRLRADQAAAEQDVHRTGEMIASRAKALGADPAHAAIVQHSFEDTARIVQNMPQEAAGKLATFATRVQGRFPGAFGVMADAKISLGNALRQTTREWEAAHLPDIQKLYDKEAPGLAYAGPPKLADEIAASPNLKAYTVQTHPEQFPNMSPALRNAIIEANNRLESTYKIAWITNPKYADPVEGNYLPQIWDTGTREVQPLPRPPGAASVTKGRAWKDWQQAYQSGVWPYKLKDMSISEYIHAGLEGTNRAIEDAVARAEILQRYGSKVQAAGTVPFRNPMYAGWHADPQVVNFVDQMYEPAPGIVREMQGAVGAARNTAYFFDVPGIAMRLATGTSQSPKIFAALLNRALASAHLPNLELYSDPNLPHTVEANLAGVQQGLAGSPIRFEGGTIFKYVPGLNKLDARLSPLVKKATQVMWGNTLTPLRNLLYEGNLMALKLTGQDITDPAVKLKAAENANAFTGASLGAAKAGRRNMEAFLLGSPQNTRAMFSQLGQVANILKVGDPASQVIAASTLASYAVSAWGLGSLINMKYGSGDPLEWNPLSRDFLTLKMNGVRISLVPQRTLLSAITKSINDLATGDPQAIGSAWAQFGYSRLSPGARIPAALAGYGYGPAGFQAGGLPTSNRLLNAAPMPPSLAQLTERPSDFLNPTLEISRNLGFPAYPFSTQDARDDAARAKGYSGWNDPKMTAADRQAIAQNPDVQAAVQRDNGPLMTIMKKYAGQQAVLDQQLAAGTLTPAQWRQARGDLNRLRTGELQGAGVGSGGTRTGDPVVDGYYAILDKYSGPAAITDKQAEQDELDAYQAKLTPAQRDDLASRTGAGLTDTPTVRQYKQDVQKLSDAGYFTLGGLIWKKMQDAGMVSTDVPDAATFRQQFNQLLRAKLEAELPGQPAAVQMYIAQFDAQAPVLRLYTQLEARAKQAYLAGHPDLAAIAAKWGFISGKAAVKAGAP